VRVFDHKVPVRLSYFLENRVQYQGVHANISFRKDRKINKKADVESMPFMGVNEFAHKMGVSKKDCFPLDSGACNSVD